MNYSIFFSALLSLTLLNSGAIHASNSEGADISVRLPLAAQSGSAPTTPRTEGLIPGTVPAPLGAPGTPENARKRRALIKGIAAALGLSEGARQVRSSIVSVASISSLEELDNLDDQTLTDAYMELCVKRTQDGGLRISIHGRPPAHSGGQGYRRRRKVVPPDFFATGDSSDEENLSTLQAVHPTRRYAPGTLPPLALPEAGSSRPKPETKDTATTGGQPAPAPLVTLRAPQSARYTQADIDRAVAEALAAASPPATSTSIGSTHVQGTSISQGAYDKVELRTDIDDTAIIRTTSGEAIARAEDYQVVPRREETCCRQAGRIACTYLSGTLGTVAGIAGALETYNDDNDNDDGRDIWRLVGFIASGILFARQYYVCKRIAKKQAYWNDRTATVISVLRNLAAVTLVAAHRVAIAFNLTPTEKARVRAYVVQSIDGYDAETQATLLADDNKMADCVETYLQQLAGEVKKPITKKACLSSCTKRLASCTNRLSSCMARLRTSCCCTGVPTRPQPPALTPEAENLLATVLPVKGCWEKLASGGFAPEAGEGWLLDRELLLHMYRHQKSLNVLMGENHAIDYRIGNATVSQWYIHHIEGIVWNLNRLISFGADNTWLVPIVDSPRNCLTEMLAQARRLRI